MFQIHSDGKRLHMVPSLLMDLPYLKLEVKNLHRSGTSQQITGKH